MKENKTHTICEDIYDLIKITALPKRQSDSWAELARTNAKLASQRLGEYLKNKNIEYSGDTSIIIGNNIKVTVENIK